MEFINKSIKYPRGTKIVTDESLPKCVYQFSMTKEELANIQSALTFMANNHETVVTENINELEESFVKNTPVCTINEIDNMTNIIEFVA